MQIVYVIPTLCNGGTEKFLMNLLANLPKKYQANILCYDDRNYWKNELNKLHVNVKILNSPSKTGIFRNMKELHQYFKEVHPDVVCAYTFYNAAYVLLAAKMCGVKIRIAHAHTSATEHRKTLSYKIYAILSKFMISCVATNKLACSDIAGKALFHGKYQIIKNGIDLEKFKYNDDFRNKIRKKMKIRPGTVLLGTVGRLDDNKNQIFMLRIMCELRDKNIKLAIIGDGPNKKNLIEAAKKMRIEKQVIFLGAVDNVNEYYNAFDLFLLTSLNEGAPYVLIEAQANGLPIIASASIDSGVKINSNFKFMNLDGVDIVGWSENAVSMSGRRVLLNEKIQEYDVPVIVKEIEQIYKEGI